MEDRYIAVHTHIQGPPPPSRRCKLRRVKLAASHLCQNMLEIPSMSVGDSMCRTKSAYAPDRGENPFRVVLLLSIPTPNCL